MIVNPCVRMFATTRGSECGFGGDFPELAGETSGYNKALYNHLRAIYVVDQARQDEFMKLTDQVDEKSQA